MSLGILVMSSVQFVIFLSPPHHLPFVVDRFQQFLTRSIPWIFT